MFLSIGRILFSPAIILAVSFNFSFSSLSFECAEKIQSFFYVRNMENRNRNVKAGAYAGISCGVERDICFSRLAKDEHSSLNCAKAYSE